METSNGTLSATVMLALSTSDSLYSKESDVFYSYGPRVEREGGDTEPPAVGEEPQFWGVYKYDNTDRKWIWVVDFDTKEEVLKYLDAL